MGGVEKARHFQRSALLLGFLEFQKEIERKRDAYVQKKYTVIEKPMKEVVSGVSHPIVGQP